MAKHTQYIIKGIDDFELSIKRQNPLTYNFKSLYLTAVKSKRELLSGVNATRSRRGAPQFT